MRIGARTVKTGLAVTLTILLVTTIEAKIGITDHNIAGMAAITAIIGMQPSIKSSLITFRNRIIATFIGTFITYLLASTIGLSAYHLGLGTIAIILICLTSRLNESIRFALITLVALGAHRNGFDIMEVVYRVSGMLMGLTVSTALNIAFMPPDYTENLKAKIRDLQGNFEYLFNNVINDILNDEKVEKEIIKNRRQILRDELDDARSVYSLLVEDVFLTRSKLPGKKAIFCKYRRSINAVQSNLERAMALHRSIIIMPEGSRYSGLRQDLHGYLNYLLTMHRHIYSSIASGKDYEKVRANIDPEELRNKIVTLIREDNHDCIFEFYNVYFEATRIKDKLEQIISEFDLDSKEHNHPQEYIGPSARLLM